jgi:hypothetical protein
MQTTPLGASTDGLPPALGGWGGHTTGSHPTPQDSEAQPLPAV